MAASVAAKRLSPVAHETKHHIPSVAPGRIELPKQGLGNFHSRTWDPARQAAGEPDLRIHDLRHTAASLAVAAGANVKAVQQMLGHASAQMTLDRYAGLFDGQLDEVADKMDEQFRDPESDSEVTGTNSVRAFKVSGIADFVAAQRLSSVAPGRLWVTITIA